MLKNILLLTALTLELLGAPQWFESREHMSNDRTFYGYGVAENEKSARANALEEIAQQINSNVDSSISMRTNSSNEYISQNIDSSTFVSSKQTLSDTKVIKLQRENNKFYILVQHIYTTPFWYESRSFEAPLFSIIGYGVGSSMKEATLEARVDISSQISSNISSSTSIITSLKNSETSIDAEDKISSSSQSILKNAKVLKSERVGKKYFVAVVHKKLPKLHCSKSQNPFLENIELIQKANRITPCKYNYGLERINDSWHLYSDGFSQELNYSQFDSFFTSVTSPLLEISSQYSSYQADDIFTLEVQSKKDGYLSIIAVYENGKVGVMLQNRLILKNTTEQFPRQKDGFELVAGLNEENRATKDLYFAFVSKRRINLADFETVADELLGEKEYRFNKVIQLCKEYEFSTTLLRTTHKNRIRKLKH